MVLSAHVPNLVRKRGFTKFAVLQASVPKFASKDSGAPEMEKEPNHWRGGRPKFSCFDNAEGDEHRTGEGPETLLVCFFFSLKNVLF